MIHPILQGEGALYRRLAAVLRQAIASGQYQPGQRMPSTRQLRNELGVSLNTVHQALQLLEAEGRVELRPQAGCYVLPRSEQSVEAPQPIPVRRTDLTLRLLNEAHRDDLLRLGGSSPNPELLATRQIRRHSARLGRGNLPNRYDFATGCPELRQQIARLMLAAGVVAQPEQVLLSGGCQEAVCACLNVLCREGDTVAVESPTFYGYLEALEMLRLNVLEIPSTDLVEGLRTALAHHRVACLLVTPNFANPSGILLSEADKRALLEFDVPVIENDIQGELHFTGPRPLALKSLDARVLYCSSFSKTLGPECRVGWVLAGPYQAAVERSLTFRSFGSSLLLRQALADYLASGQYSRHVGLARRAYARQAGLVHQLLRAHLPPGSRVNRPAGGKMLWVELPVGSDALELYARCRSVGITLSPGSIYSVSDRYRHCFRVNCSYWDDTTREGLLRLCGLAGR